MEIAYYDLSGGIKLSSTKTELGIDTKKIYWTDSKNIEVLQNRGIVKQKGNTMFLDLPEAESITGMAEMTAGSDYKLVITTESGKIYIYHHNFNKLTLLEKTMSGSKPFFAGFLDGMLVISKNDPLFYIKNNTKYEIVECELKNGADNLVRGEVLAVHKGRVWVASDSTIYYSALGSYTDFTTEKDAGYISNFHTNTAEIIALKPYKDYLAIYKKNMVYLLTGTSPEDFMITPFANKGSSSSNAIVNVDNKQYFLSNGIFALEQVGELNQIQLGSEISLSIKPEFEKFNKADLNDVIAVHYEDKSQVWYFFPYIDEGYFHTVWINDYVNRAWYKREIPQNIVTSCMFNGSVLTADNDGKVYKEDFGVTFDGRPVEFMWKSPFLAVGSAHHRKMIDEFYFILDASYNNDFNFSVYKDYDSEYSDDKERIYSIHMDHFVWNLNDANETNSDCWSSIDDDKPIWPINRDTLEKAEISEANYSIQLCVEGDQLTNSCAIIGLQLREIYNDD